MEVIFVRHGETQHNKHHQIMGQRIDDPLDEEGLHQASDLLSKLPDDAEIIFCSPLKRALQTAGVISRHLNVPVKTSDLLKERDFGSLSGKTWHEIDSETGKGMHALDEHLKYDYRPYGGESVEQVKARLLKFLDMLKAKHSREKVIVVTHYGLILIMDSLYPPKRHERVANVSVHKYKI